MTKVVISGTGLLTLEETITNEELVEVFNEYVAEHNSEHAEQIAAGEIEALQLSSVEFIEKASGIKQRYVLNKSGILDKRIMHPVLPRRTDDELSHQAEMGVEAAKQALFQASKAAKDIDLVIVACSNMERAYPAISIEIQNTLGTQGYAYDMNVACSSATFGIKAAADAIISGSANSVLVISPEICSGHLEFKDRDCHFIFGDVATAVLVEKESEKTKSKFQFEVVSTRLKTVFSNNIRNNFGFLKRAHHIETPVENQSEKNRHESRGDLFKQQGRKVFKEVVPMVSELILDHLNGEGIDVSQIKRLWLHQANINMNQLISRKVLGRDALEDEAPVILDDYANTSSAGCIIALHKYHSDLVSGDLGILCSFGAGYSAGNIILKKI